MSLTSTEIIILSYANWAASLLSLFGCLFVFVSYRLFGDTRNRQLRWIYFFTISNLFGSFSFVLSIFTQENLNGPDFSPCWLCVLQGVGIQYFYVVSSLWMVFIARSIYQSVILLVPHDEGDDLMAHIVCWGFPSVPVVILLSTSSFGNAGIWCWITEDNEMYRYLFFYGPTFFCFVSVAAIYFYVGWRMKSMDKDDISGSVFQLSRIKMSDKVTQRAKQIVLVFVLAWCVGITSRLYALFNDNYTPFWLSFLHSVGSSIGGFINSIIYVRNSSLIVSYRRYFYKTRSSEKRLMAGAPDGPLLVKEDEP